MAPQDEYLNIRIDPDLKSALQAAAEREGRSVGNLVKQLIRQHCAENSLVLRSPTPQYKVARRKK